MSPDDPRHGTYAGAVQHWAAREPLCDPCALAANRYTKGRKIELVATGQARRVPSWRVRRRKEALQALGWTVQDIADAAGITFAAAWNAGKKGDVYRSTYEAIDTAYQRLHMTRPEGRYRTRTRNRARRNDWAPPAAWDDIDDPNETPSGVTPDGYRRRNEDVIAEAEHLIGLGESFEQAARALGIAVESLEKAYERAKKEAA